jgi:CubicO group peptidase (beta-lactamase class C family)
MRSWTLFVLVACQGGPADRHPTPNETTGPSSPWTTPTATIDPALLEPILAQLAADLEANDAPAVSVAIRLGDATWAQALGSADPILEVPVTPQTLFQIGSTTKMLTAMAVLQQADAGQLTVDDEVWDHLPEFSFADDPKITRAMSIHHLLTHQGGFYDWLDWDGPTRDADLYDWTHSYPDANWLMSPPGAFWNYSNPNFVVAGLIAELRDGRSYPDLLRQDLLLPLGMEQTVLRNRDLEGQAAVGVGLDLDGNYGPMSLDDIADPAHARPAGSSTWSTPTEMLAVADLLMHGNPDVLSDASVAAMTQPHVALEGAWGDDHYGYGIMVRTGLNLDSGYQETTVWEHGGNTLSHTSDFYLLPDHDFAISVLSSGYGTDFTGTIVVAIETLIDLGEPETPPEVTLDPDRLDDHVGSYRDPSLGGFVVTREGDTLQLEMPLLAAYGYKVGTELEPLGNDAFLLWLDSYPYEVTFLGGSPSQYMRNRSFVGVRQDSAALQGEPGAPPQLMRDVPIRRL